MRKSKRTEAPSLMQLIGFDEDDLAANRKNAISKRQVAALQRHAGRWLDIYAFAIGIGVIADFSIIYFGHYFGEDSGSVAGKVFIASAIAVLLLGYAWLMRGSQLIVIQQQKVERVEGYAHPYFISWAKSMNRGSAEHRVEIEDMSFRVSKQVFQAFEPRTYYRVYYAPIFKKILSVEEGRIPNNEASEIDGSSPIDPTTIRPASTPRTRHKRLPSPTRR